MLGVIISLPIKKKREKGKIEKIEERKELEINLEG